MRGYNMSPFKNFMEVHYWPSDVIAYSKAPYKTTEFQYRDNMPIMEATHIAINPMFPGSTKRSRRYVATYRSFLVEFDKMTMEDQLAFVDKIGMPFTTAVFSGNKSVHFVITLEQEVSADEWVSIARRLKKALPEADQACFDPVRLTRIPTVKQPLLKINEVVNLHDLEGFIYSRYKPSKKDSKPVVTKRLGMTVITKKTRQFIWIVYTQ
jgi:hypothetical protein